MSHAARPVRPGLILGICCLSLMLIGMDVTIVNVAIPGIQRGLGASLQDMQWVINGYTLVIASLLLLTGSLSDRYGRKRVFLAGLSVFTLASLLCSLATGIDMLVACRLLQGLGASMLNPVALSIVAHTFQEPKARARAIGVWGAVFGVALGLGPVLGGLLTQTIGWRAIFMVNIPVGMAAIVLTMVFVPESGATRARALDAIGQVLVIVALGALSFAAIEGQRDGWTSGLVVGCLALCLASVASLVAYERRIAEPLLDVRFFRSVPFSTATVIAVLAFGSFAAILFLNAIYLQQERGFSALQAGFCTLPLAAVAAVAGPVSGRMVANHGTRPSILLAAVAMLASALLLTRMTHDSPLPELLVAYALFGLGLGMVNPAIATVAVAGLPKAQTGVAAAIASTSRQLGASLGVAAAGTVISAGAWRGLDVATAAHALWWGMAGLAWVLALLGWLANTPWAHASARRSAALIDGGPNPA